MSAKKVLMQNIVSLFVLKGTNYILPLLTFPYLVRILGGEKYGLMVFSITLTQFLSIFCDFGFNYTATRKIAVNKGNSILINNIFKNILLIKMIFTVLSLLIMLAIVSFVGDYSHFINLFLVSFISVIGNSLFPLWFFQGMENMRFITVVNMTSKIIGTISTFIFVKLPTDYVIAAFFQALPFLISGIVGLIAAIYYYKIKFRWEISFLDIKSELKDSWKVFTSTLASNIYVLGSTLIVGLICGNKVVGYFAVAQKIGGALTGLCQPFSQAIYPYLCNLQENHKEKFKSQVVAIKKFSLATSLVIAVLTIFFSGMFVTIVTGEANHSLANLVSLWSVIIFFTINNIIFNTFILSMEKYDQLQKMYIPVSFVFILISIPLTYFLEALGMSISLLLVEMYIFIGSLIITKIRKSTLEQLKLET